jgi:hypothetical protein
MRDLKPHRFTPRDDTVGIYMKKLFLILSLFVLMIHVAVCEENVFNFNLSKDVQKIVVLIQGEQEGGQTYAPAGTGFFYNSGKWVYLITMKHVLLDKYKPEEFSYKKVKCLFYTAGSKEDVSNELTIGLSADMLNKTIFLSQKDVAAVRLGRYRSGAWEYVSPQIAWNNAKQGKSMICGAQEVSLKFDNIDITENTIIFGFPPASGGYNIDFPLFRKGIVAGKDYDKKVLVLDSLVAPGNAGGPAFVLRQNTMIEKYFYLIGLTTEYVPFSSASKEEKKNAGYTVVEPMDTVFELIKQAER